MKQTDGVLTFNESRICQIHAAAISKMRTHLERTDAKIQEGVR
ncbi:MAG: hypothetical protein AAB225_07725 [Acidobacteriota bacterium]